MCDVLIFQMESAEKETSFFFPLLDSLINNSVLSVLVTQSYLTLCDPMDCSPLGSSVHGILQARILGWVAIPFSGDLPDPGIEPKSPALQEDSLPSEPPEKPPHTRLNYFEG